MKIYLERCKVIYIFALSKRNFFALGEFYIYNIRTKDANLILKFSSKALMVDENVKI